MKCKTKFCRNKARKNGTKCNTCFSREYRAKHPIKSAYQNLRANAKRRNKEFDISFEYFSKFVIEAEYMMGKGRSKESYTIDRIDETKGYIEGNLQVLSNSQNIQKSHKHRKRLKFSTHEGVPDQFWFEPVNKPTPTDTDGCPF